MDRDQIENKIEHLFANFSEQFTRTKNYKSIPQIELDLMMATIRDLYAQLHQLNSSVQSPKEKAKVTIPEIIEEKNVASENVVHAIISRTEPLPVVPEVVVNETINKEENPGYQREEEVQVATSIKRENVFTEQTKTQAKAVGSLFDDVPTIAGNYKEQQSLHHKIGKTKTERYSDKLQQQPVVDLKRSIGINEKFAFMNELFGGNQQQYTQSIETLNNFSNYEEAQAHLQNLASDMKWNISSNTYQELDELVKRRFGV